MNDEARDWLVRRAIQGAPHELCGVILESGEIVEIRNVSLAPMRAFKFDRNQLVEKLRGRGEFVTGIWHTHPRGTTHPSHTDLAGIKCGAIQRNWDYYIVTSTGVHQYDTKLYAPQNDSFWHQFRSEQPWPVRT